MKEHGDWDLIVRVCRAHMDCEYCPLAYDPAGCLGVDELKNERALEIARKWCAEHPEEQGNG